MDREKLVKALAGTFGDTYDCTRVWEAWGYGTMTSADFLPVDVERVADEILAEMESQDDLARKIGEAILKMPVDSGLIRSKEGFLAWVDELDHNAETPLEALEAAGLTKGGKG